MALIDDLIKDGYLKTPAIINAFKTIKREDFLRQSELGQAEINAPLPIGQGQTISQPLTVAFMLELLEPKGGDKILDVGSGSGWTTALLAEIVGANGKVFGVELIPELKEFGENNTSKYNFIKKGIASFICGDGNQGLNEKAPFDKILVSAATPEIPPALLTQLKVSGRMVLPVGEWYSGQDMVVVEKLEESKFSEERFPGFVFVPLKKIK